MVTKRKKKVADLQAVEPSKEQKLDHIFNVKPKQPEKPEAEELTPSVAASHAQVADVAPSASVTSAAQDTDLSSPGVAVDMETTKDAEQDSNNASHGSAADGNAFNQADEEADEEASGVSPPLAALASSSAVKVECESDDPVQQPTPAHVLPEAAASGVSPPLAALASSSAVKVECESDDPVQQPTPAHVLPEAAESAAQPSDHLSDTTLGHGDVESMGMSPSRPSMAMEAPKQYKYLLVLK